jgi:asparagine synthase (glutamine-hydrolysing)
MCGIVGFIGPPHSERRARAFVHATLEAQHARGPDSRGICRIAMRDSVVVLGHNRLSIIDLSNAAHQPMTDGSGRCTITFNGEIYNYLELKSELECLGAQFRTHSDTEVILESYKYWGRQFVDRLNGMFSLAIIDEDKQSLLLARDRFGVKPLFFVARGTMFAFASSARALALQFDCAPCLQYVIRGATYGVFEDGHGGSAFEGVSSLRPGTVRNVSLGRHGLSTHHCRYYDLREAAANRIGELIGKTSSQIRDQLDHTLQDAVALRLRADVPVAVSLSGGLDSSLVASEAARQHGGITGFCYGSPDAEKSEGPLVARFAPFANVEPRFIWPALDRQSVCEAFDSALRAQEAPFGSTSIVAQHLVFRDVRACGFKVLLGGQGGDEAFLGYRKWAAFAVIDAWRRRLPGRLLSAFINLVLMAQAEVRQTRGYWHDRHRFFGSAILPVFGGPVPPVKLGMPNDEALSDRQIRDILELSLPTLLRFEDRNSMGNSVESRLPFLDYRVVEYGVALPLAMKLNRGFGKWCLREITSDRLPREIHASRLKRGFDVAQDWLGAGLGAYLRLRISEAAPKLQHLLRPDVDLRHRFCDDGLRTSTRCFAEAVGIVWLADQIR